MTAPAPVRDDPSLTSWRSLIRLSVWVSRTAARSESAGRWGSALWGTDTWAGPFGDWEELVDADGPPVVTGTLIAAGRRAPRLELASGSARLEMTFRSDPITTDLTSWYGPVAAGDRIQVRPEWVDPIAAGTATLPDALWTGYVRNVSDRWNLDRSSHTITVDAVDLIGILRDRRPDPGAGGLNRPIEELEVRVAAMLELLEPFPGAIDYAALAPALAANNLKARDVESAIAELDRLFPLNTSQTAILYVDHTVDPGPLTMSTTTINPSLYWVAGPRTVDLGGSNVWVFAESDSTGLDTGQVRNVITVPRKDSTAHRAVDLRSVARYGEKHYTTPESDFLADTVAVSIAEQQLIAAAYAARRVGPLTVSIESTASVFRFNPTRLYDTLEVLVGLTPAHRNMIRRYTAGGASAGEYDASALHAQTVRHLITAGRWSVEVTLEPDTED